MRDLDEKTKERVLAFISMCNDLESLISRENTLFLDKGSVAFDGFFVKKINMLNKFEKDIRDVLLLAKEKAPENIGLRRLLVEKIQEVRRTLSINTTFQLRDLKKRTARMEGLKDMLLNFSKHDEEGDTICH